MDQLRIDVATQAGCLVVVVCGELDLTTSDQLLVALDSGRTRGLPVIADLTRVEFCAVSGLRALLTASEHCRAAGTELRVVPSESVQYLISLTNTGTALDVYADRNHALADAVYHSREGQQEGADAGGGDAGGVGDAAGG